MEEAEEENTRLAIREELASMSFEEILKLKEELGAKVYSEAVFGAKRVPKTDFKRANKNRPREMSSKTPVHNTKKLRNNVGRDPRFDPLCGTFNDETFKNAYSFVNEIRDKEKEQLKNELEKETNTAKKEKIKYILQRMENQDREERRHKEKLEKLKLERQEQIEMLKQGKKPWFKKKSERRVLQLVDQYEELKKKGKLQKHIEKQRKKSAHVARKKLPDLSNASH
ncbi:ribosomal RNA processing protein 36 homolog isoform X2 [Schistocerca americana]|uniref:ribosomal RNA processing protein 36 homolog isoform X2 n=1 Tax=Schistocerca americana TaxID=7009 RepID=UPI001F4F4FB5|nr:ribosomal RNA processing protein 36 homolog isoform X2 [Schistocerca americana]